MQNEWFLFFICLIANNNKKSCGKFINIFLMQTIIKYDWP